MTFIDTVVVGAGHAGLAVSALLSTAGHEHVVLERGRVAERWRTERWDSLRLLTPNWMTRLPGWHYSGPDPDRYLSAGEFARYLERYAASFDAPVIQSTTVEDVSLAPRAPGGPYQVVTDRGVWHARHVVVATGPHGAPRLPAAIRAGDLRAVEVVASRQYRNPRQLPPGGVLVVGASSSGVQIADELARAGRQVVLAVGRHTRTPRRYRGMDIFCWLERTGRLARTIDEMPDASAARREPSMQLIGAADARNLDLATVRASGVRLAGRLERVAAGRAWFRDDLADSVSTADRRLHRLLDRIDDHATAAGLDHRLLPSVRPRAVDLPSTPRRLNLRAEGIGTVLLATGHRPHHPWLRLPVLAPDGTIAQHRGVTPAPGVYVVGQRFQHRRDSALIDGARHDADAIVRHLLGTAAGKAPNDLDPSTCDTAA
ncbi:MAG TPA: NAD(P)-binding domain-containing protein [Kribbellaceae bacterium]